MGNPHSKPEDRLHSITRDVNSLRSSLRQSRQNLSRDKKEAIVESLAYQSSEVSSMHGQVKQKKIDEALKTISATMEEILQIEPRELDMGAVETDSFIHVPINHRRANSLGSLVSQKPTSKTSQSQSRAVNRTSVSTIREIEAKFDDLKPLITTAMDNQNTKQLRVYKTTIEILARDLEMININEDKLLEQRKNSLMKKLTFFYQKISKNLKEFKREDNLQYLSEQSRKEKAVNALANIELYLAENESLLDKMAQERNTANVAAIRSNVMQISQKLAKVDIVDKDIKGRVVVLSQKLTEIVKNLDRTMAKKEFDSKFMKSLETYERVVRNFNEDTNAQSTMNTLENIRNSVQNLDEINDTTKNRKRELLSNINKQIENLEDSVKKESDRKTIQQLVEDNVMLRRKVKSSDKEHTVIDQFISYWTNVRENFDVNAYSNLSLLRIDRILEDMQQSINDIRVEIAKKCDTNPPSNLIKKHSQSVPKLNSRKSYGSNNSLDQLDSKIIKTKAKMYNLSTPELLNVQKQEATHVNNRFSKIEEIKMQVHYIKEKIDESHNKNLLREKLESYLQDLAVFHKDQNKTVSNNALFVSRDITELLHLLVIAEYKENAEKLIKGVQNFKGTSYDKEYDELREKLIKVQIFMENFNIPEQYELLRRDKEQLLDEVFYHIQLLQEKATLYKRPEDENFKKIKAKLQSLGEKVKRFSGTYKGVLYNQIERDLNKIQLLIGEQVDDKVNADEVTKQVERLQKILEQRASLAQSFRASKPESTKTEDQILMTKIKSDLFNIKKEIDKTPEENIEAFIGLQSRLDLVTFELGQITSRSNENLDKEKEIFSNETQTLKNVVDAKVALSQQPLIQWPEREQPDLKDYPKNDVNKEMEKLENKFQKIKDEVNAPNTGEDIHKYYKLAQDIRKLLEKLDQYKFIKGTDLYMRKITLLNEMHYYLEALEKEAKDADYVISIEKKVDTLQSILNSEQTSDLKAMAQELQAIQGKLDNHKVNASNQILSGRKTSVQQKTDDLALQLKELANNEMKEKQRNEHLKEETKKISDVEEKVKALKPKVFSFIGTEADSKYYELDETIMRLTSALDKLETSNAELQKRKIKLLKELHTFGQILDERAQQTQDIVDLEQQSEELSLVVGDFSGNEEDLIQIKTKLEKLVNKVRSIKINKELIPRKNAYMEKLHVLFNKVMALTVSTQVAPVTSIQKYQDANHAKVTQSTGTSVTSSNRTTITEHSSVGYTTQMFNFTENKNGNMIHFTNNATQSNDNILVQTEQEIKQLEAVVHSSNNANKLEEMFDVLNKYTMQLHRLDYPKESAEYKAKVKLYQMIESLTEIIEDKLEDNQIIQNIDKIEQEIDEIGNKMNTPLTDEQINQLDERLIQLHVTLGKINDPARKSQVDGCVMKIILYIQNISDYKKSIKNTAV